LSKSTTIPNLFYPDQIVFFKKGKFYELYEKDADIGHQEFDLKLTDRVNMRMVGVPEMSFDMWAAQFVARGYVLLVFMVVRAYYDKILNATF
jgi:DNA mismatch repair protein MSH6